MEHGFLDAIVGRKEMKAYLIQALTWMWAAAGEDGRGERRELKRVP